MRYLPLLWAGLFRRKTRTILTLLSIVVAFALFGLLQAVQAAFESGADAADAKRLLTTARYSIIEPLPMAYQRRIEQVPGVVGVAYADWFGAKYQNESNAGNDVRRVGEEGLFEQLVEQNLQAFGKAQFQRIVTTDPHSFNTLKNEYPQHGGKFEVQHYTVLLARLFDEGKLTIKNKLTQYKVTFHDPCYLGRYNGGFAAPRKLLELLGVEFHEMPRNCENSFCCGAGGGQIWMSKVAPGERPAENRIREALATFEKHPGDKKQLFIVTCPKDMIMYSDAVKTTGNEDKIEVRDIIQLIAEAIALEEPAAAEAIAIPA